MHIGDTITMGLEGNLGVCRSRPTVSWLLIQLDRLAVAGFNIAIKLVFSILISKGQKDLLRGDCWVSHVVTLTAFVGRGYQIILQE